MRAWLFLLFLIPQLLQGGNEDFFSNDENPTLFHHVNVITGHLNISFQDGTVEGAQQLPLMRGYASSGALTPAPKKVSRALEGGWNLFPQIQLYLEGNDCIAKSIRASLIDQNGCPITYIYKKNKTTRTYLLKSNMKPHPSYGKLNAKFDSKNNLIEFNHRKQICTVLLPDGGRLIYKPFRKDPYISHNTRLFHLQEEITPSGHRICYYYDNTQQLQSIQAKNPSGTKVYAWIRLERFNSDAPYPLKITTSDGKIFDYTGMEHNNCEYLKEVRSNCRFDEHLDYTEGRGGMGARLQSASFQGQLQFFAEYYRPSNRKEEKKWAESPKKMPFYIDKVKTLKAPVGPGGELVPIANFTYQPGVTDVRDANQILTRFHYAEGKLTQIEYFKEQDQLASSLRFFWNNHRITSKVFLNEKGEPKFAKLFRYDDKGNVLEEIFSGNLTGNASEPFTLDRHGNLIGAELFHKKFSYQERDNLLSYETEEEGPSTRYAYLPETNLLTSKLLCDHERIKVREFYGYDADHLLTLQIVDDGSSPEVSDLSDVTYREIQRFERDDNSGLIGSYSTSYLDLKSGQEILKKKMTFTYSPQNKVIRVTTFDATGKECYTLETDYDAHGNVIRQTTPLEQENLYEFDALNRLISAKEVGQSLKKYTYDTAGRQVATQEIDVNGALKLSSATYDRKGGILCQTDSRGNSTDQTYDALGRCIQTLFPQVQDAEGSSYRPSVQFSYDAQGNLISHTLLSGETTSNIYNAFRKPTLIIHADQSQTRHVYRKNGILKQTLHPDGSYTLYDYDCFKRKIAETIHTPEGECLSSQSWTYDSNFLKSYTDSRGLITHYYYDAMGRKSQEIAEGRILSYNYDALGYLERTTIGECAHIESHDLAGRVVQAWDDNAGLIENHTESFYNEENQKIKAIRQSAKGNTVDFFAYDGEGRLTSHTDPYGAVTHFIYSEETQNALGQRVLQKTILDPLENGTIETYDAANRLVSTKKTDPEGQVVAEERLYYDAAGNKAKCESDVYHDNEKVSTTAVYWNYDAMGRVVLIREGGEKESQLQYDLKGRLITKTLPSGVTLSYIYDSLDRVLETRSSDETIHLLFTYALGPEPIKAHDPLHNLTLEFSYNHFGERLSEKNSRHSSLYWQYDRQGNCKGFALPDRSFIAYEYRGSHLTAVSRHTPSGERLYQHKYLSFDPNGHVAKEELIYHLETITTAYDLLERPSHQTASWFTQQAQYGLSGLITKTSHSMLGEKTYAYDPLKQLVRENEQVHHFDSLGNPTAFQVNALNQVEATPTSLFSYDPNGNPIQEQTSTQEILYEYDALGRLIAITPSPTRKIEFIYDPLARLYSKIIYTRHKGQWKKGSELFYLYDHEKEIGTLDAEGEILELKVLGLGLKEDIGAAVALELYGQTYAPLHDFNGNLVALLSVDNQLVEIYDMDAFGQELLVNEMPLSPWRFCSKRHEENFVFFGKRFYVPSLNRWLTPDPAGFTEGPNLYAYVLNSPLNRLDVFGLFGEDRFDPSKPFTIQMPTFHHFDVSKAIACKGFVGETQVDLFVSCNYLQKIQFTPEESTTGQINLVDHFHELIPKNGQIIGACIVQNGINTSFEELGEMVQSIRNKIPEGTCIIGLYNQTEGFTKDLKRVDQELKSHDTQVVINTRQFMAAFIENVAKVNPQTLVYSTAHSEGGLIHRRAIEGMTPDQQSRMKQNLLYLGVGTAGVMPKAAALETLNIYSKSDRVTKLSSRLYRNDPHYNIQILPCQSSWSEMTMYFADHAFMGQTYQEGIRQNIEETRSKHGFYNGQTR